MSAGDVLDRLDELIAELTNLTGCDHWEIHIRSDIAKTLFGHPLPMKYKSNFIIVDDTLIEIKTDEGMKSDVVVLRRQ